MIRGWLARAPVLLTAYLVWVNRGRQRGRRRLSAALALFIAWMAAVSVSIRTDRATAISTLAWLHRHDLFWAAISAVVAGVLVSRRRALNQVAASRSWTAALPVERSTYQWQAIAVAALPALVFACILAAVFGSLSFIALFEAGIPAPVITWAGTTGGVVLGAGLGYLLPPAKQEEIYESSRYVPHRRRAETPIPTGSLSALGTWPVRHMLGSARPKTIARTMLPISLAVRLGSTAADVLLAIGLLAALGVLVLLVVATVSVSAHASGWLAPLPIDWSLSARRTLTPALAFMVCVTAIESWLIWVLGSSVARCMKIGVLTLAAAIIVAVAGSLLTIHTTTKSAGERI